MKEMTTTELLKETLRKQNEIKEKIINENVNSDEESDVEYLKSIFGFK